MGYKVLFLDIDGTILGTNHKYTSLTKNAIIQAQNNGLEVFLATGRSLHEIRPLASELNIHSFIAYNGAIAEHNGEIIVFEPIDQHITEKILKLTQSYGHEAVAYTKDSNLVTSLTDSFLQRFLDNFNFTNRLKIDQDRLNEILSMTIVNVNEESISYYKNLNSIHMTQVNVDGFRNCYDITKFGVNKGVAVEEILKYLNISRKATIAFGDGMNDAQMLMTVEESFAMSNGNPNLFQYAKHKAKSPEESGIYYGLKQLNVI